MATKEYENGSNPADDELQKGTQAGVQNKQDKKLVTTVTPDNDNGDLGKPVQKDSSNKGKGPSGENL